MFLRLICTELSKVYISNKEQDYLWVISGLMGVLYLMESHISLLYNGINIVSSI